MLTNTKTDNLHITQLQSRTGQSESYWPLFSPLQRKLQAAATENVGGFNESLQGVQPGVSQWEQETEKKGSNWCLQVHPYDTAEHTYT